MLLVVVHHVSIYSFKVQPEFSFNSVLLTFRMPLFFFLSGFLFFKSNLFINKAGYFVFLRKKLKVQIVPTLFFGSLFALMMQIPVPDMLFHQTKHGYWFTIVLFFYFFFFSSVSYVCRKVLKINSENDILRIILLSAILISFPSFISDLYAFHPKNKYLEWTSALLSFNKWWYYVYFVFGATVKRLDIHFNKFRSSSFIALVLMLELLLLLLRHYFGATSPFCLYGLADYLLGFLGIIIIVSFFSGNENLFSRGNILGKFLQHLGVRTLDIYLLHYFFVPRNLEQVGRWLENYCNPIIELSAEVTVALAVIFFCLVASSLIRCSDHLAKLLFGKII